MEHVEDARRQASVEEAFHEPMRRHRRERGGLEDDGVPRDERGRHFPRRDGDGEVPRRDERDDAEWLLSRQQLRGSVGAGECLAAQPPTLPAKEAQDVGGAVDLARGLGQRLALLGGEFRRDLSGPGPQQLRGARQNRPASGGRRLAPRRLRVRRGPNRRVHVLSSGLRHPHNNLGRARGIGALENRRAAPLAADQ